MMLEQLSFKKENGDIDLSKVRGVGAVVLNERSELLVGREGLAKREHQRAVGQISIPLETLKPFERKNVNALKLAAISEIVTNSNIKLLSDSLKEVGLTSPLTLNEAGVEGVGVVLRWTGGADEMPFIPSVPEEFSNLRWMTLDKFYDLNSNIRPFARTIVERVSEFGLLEKPEHYDLPILKKLRPNQYAAVRDLYADVI